MHSVYRYKNGQAVGLIGGVLGEQQRCRLDRISGCHLDRGQQPLLSRPTFTKSATA